MSIAIDQDLSQQLLEQTIGVSMRMTRFGNAKKLDDQCHSTVAQSIDADPDRIRATEVIVNSKHPAYKTVTSHMSKVKRTFTDSTIAFPEPTIRLMHCEKLERFQAQVESDQDELRRLVVTLDQHRNELVEDARRKLGNAFKPDYYPASFANSFSIEVAYPSIGPDERLRQLNPRLYEEQQRRFIAQVEQAIEETTAALAEQFAQIVARLVEAYQDGKRLNANAIDPLNNFLERFAEIRLGSSTQLRELIEQARGIVNEHAPVQLYRSSARRSQVAASLAPLQESIQAVLERAPVRQIRL